MQLSGAKHYQWFHRNFLVFSCIFRGKGSYCTGTDKSVSRYNIYLEQIPVYWYIGISLHPYSRDIDFSICKAQVKSMHCSDFVLVKSLLKVPTIYSSLIFCHILSWTPAINLLQSRSDKIKKVVESGDILLFTSKFFHPKHDNWLTRYNCNLF